jgi:hypothetical protein
MVEAMGRKLLHRGSLEYHYAQKKFHENLVRGSKVISGDRHFGMIEVTSNAITTTQNFIQIH